jgi:hypothetical protein
VALDDDLTPRPARRAPLGGRLSPDLDADGVEVRGLHQAFRVDTDAAALIRARRERDRARHEVTQLEAELVELRRVVNIIESVDDVVLDPPSWLAPKNTRSSKRATLVVMLSDTHFDEVVRPSEVGGLNAYNRTIAELRLKTWCENVIKMARHYLSGVTYDGVVVLLGGDIFSGDIHEELKETNEDTILGSLLHWSEQMAAAITVLADEFGKVHVAAVPGNHGRLTRKPRAKLRAKTNLDWLLAKMLERHYAKDKRVTFQIEDGADTLVGIYQWGHLLTHGDQAHGGGGIGGIWPPIMRLRAKKAQRAMAVDQPFDTLWMGHWHQLIITPGLVVNGSLKSVDEYSFIGNFGYEPAQQALAIVTPEHNVTWQCPVFVTDRRKEKW